MITLDFAGLSEQGPVRDNNEDYIASHSPSDPAAQLQKGWLFVVADGVGGNRAGEVASRQAAEKLIETYFASGKKSPAALQAAFKRTNLHICDLGMTNPVYRRMATTLSALALVGDRVHIGHVGDSRIYHIRGAEVQLLTRDHSEVGELVRMQILTPEEAQHHPRRHIITRSIGSDLMTQIDYRTEPVQAGDRFVLCTDGLWDALLTDEIAEVVRSAAPADACRRMIAQAIDRGADDNLSVQVVNVVELVGEPVEASVRKNGFFKRRFNLLGAARLVASR